MPLAAPVLMGNQTPTHLVVPPFHSNAAAETIDLYHSLGERLDPWQQTSLHAGLGEDPLGEWAAFLVALLVQRQNGKGNVAEARGLGGLFLFGDPKIIHSAHRVDTATNAFRRVKQLIDANHDLSRRVKRMNESSGEAFVELMDGRMWEFRTRGRDGGRGLSAADTLPRRGPRDGARGDGRPAADIAGDRRGAGVAVQYAAEDRRAVPHVATPARAQRGRRRHGLCRVVEPEGRGPVGPAGARRGEPGARYPADLAEAGSDPS
jgi:hypothetical protein